MSSQNNENHFRLLLLLLNGATLVERKLFDSKVTGTLSAFLSGHQNTLKELNKKKAINNDQLALLFSSNPKSEDFDISLLTCLLRNICGLAKATDTVWTKPGVNDLSTEADIARLKEHRNQISHLSEVGISHADFQKKWTEICEVLNRLNTGLHLNSIIDLQTQLDAYKTDPIDQTTVDHYENLLKQWMEQEMAEQKAVLEELAAIKDVIDQQHSVIQKDLEKLSSNQHTVHQGILQDNELTRQVVKEEGLKTRKQLELSPELKSLLQRSETYFVEANEKESIFVKTHKYDEARTILDTTGIVILSGPPGEGKTTMANMLLLQSSSVSSILKLSDPSEWSRISTKGYSILIDDIFGSCILDEQLLCQWKNYLPELNREAYRRNIAAVVITTRQYILNEALCKINKNAKGMFKHVVILSSENMSEDERLTILNKHLSEKGKHLEKDEKDVICLDHGIGDREGMIGFPVCVDMFTSNDDLFAKGKHFFEAPYDYFLESLDSISNAENREMFMSLILAWSSDLHTINESAFYPDKISGLVSIAKDFNYTKVEEKAEILRKNLKQLEECFLTFDDKNDTYSFRYHIIADAVGITAAKTNQRAAIKYGSRSFILRHLTTLDYSERMVVKIKKQNFMFLVERMNKLLFEEIQEDSSNDDTIHNTLLPGMVSATPRSIVSVLQNDAFRNKDFIREYLNSTDNDIKTNCLHKPILYAYNYFKARYHLSFPMNEMPLCMPSTLFALGNKLMLIECLNQDFLSENEKRVSLLLAIQKDRRSLVGELIKRGKVEVSEDALKVASSNGELFNFIMRLNHTLPDAFNTGDVELVRSRLESLQFQSMDTPCSSKLPQQDIGDIEASGPSPGTAQRSFNDAVISDVIPYIIGCQLILRRRTQIIRLGGRKVDVYELGCAELLNKLEKYPQKDNTEDCLRVISKHSKSPLVQILLSKDIYYQYRKLMKDKIGKQSIYHHAILNDDIFLLHVASELTLDPNRKDVCGRSPLYLAAYYGKYEFVEMMLNIPDVNIELSERNGLTPLHAAVLNSNQDVVSLLLARGANVNSRDNRSNTPLHIACKNANKHMISILIRNNRIDTRMINKNGETIFHSLCCALEKSPNKRVKNCLRILLNNDPLVNEWLPRVIDIPPLFMEF